MEEMLIKLMFYDEEFFNLTFRELLEENYVCFIQNRDRDKKMFMGVELTPFEFLVLSEAKNENYIIEVIGGSLPNDRGSYVVSGKISSGISTRMELEHAIFWQNLFKSFTSYLIFLYVLTNAEAIEAFKSTLAKAGQIFKHTTKGNERTFGIVAIPANDYLVYLNTHKISPDNIHIKQEDLTSIMQDVSELIPDIKFQ